MLAIYTYSKACNNTGLETVLITLAVNTYTHISLASQIPKCSMTWSPWTTPPTFLVQYLQFKNSQQFHLRYKCCFSNIPEKTIYETECPKWESAPKGVHVHVNFAKCPLSFILSLMLENQINCLRVHVNVHYFPPRVEKRG